MSFFQIIQKYDNFEWEEVWQRVSDQDVLRTLQKDTLRSEDLLILLSPAAGNHLEAMAQKAHRLTVQNFGKVMHLYTPLYLANYCTNRCVYCGLNVTNKIRRKKLTLEEVEQEAKAIAAKGLRHLIILTGESRVHTPVSYIKDCVRILNQYFTSISIEIYPLNEEEYGELIEVGVDGLTVYQETYNQEIYDRIHLAGDKKDYRFRLDTPERACKQGIRTVNVGALLGLDNWRRELFFVALHSWYLQNKYFDVEVGASMPRIRPHAGDFEVLNPVSDREMVQGLLALRLFMPRLGVTVSTRESAQFRDNLIPLGITKISAESSTAVGGYATDGEGTEQFEISDNRTVQEIHKLLLSKGYQPVFKDWQTL